MAARWLFLGILCALATPVLLHNWYDSGVAWRSSSPDESDQEEDYEKPLAGDQTPTGSYQTNTSQPLAGRLEGHQSRSWTHSAFAQESPQFSSGLINASLQGRPQESPMEYPVGLLRAHQGPPRLGTHTLQGSPAGLQRVPRSSSWLVPEIFLVYNMENFPGNVEAECYSGDITTHLTMSLVPGSSDNPFIRTKYTRPEVLELEWNTWTWGRAVRARGMTCGSQGHPHQVMAPLLRKQAEYVPQQLSVTVDKGQHVRITFRKVDSVYVRWQKEPVSTSGWTNSELSSTWQLTIRASQLSGSGFYSIISQDTDKYLGTFVVLIRDCPEGYYGSDCSDRCYCQYGGDCHPQTGECVCPPYLTGNQCQRGCSNKLMGRECTVSLLVPQGKQVCLPQPLGCHCVPGYTGDNCDKECGTGYWGLGCQQTCRSGCQVNCDKQTGECPPGQHNPDCNTVPAAVTDVTITDTKPDSVVLTWTVPSDVQYCGLKIYVFVSDEPNSKWEGYDPPALVSPLMPNTQYTFTVLVRSDDGRWSPRSNTNIVTGTTLLPKPGPPGVTYNLENKMVNFRWRRTTSDLGSIMYSYLLTLTETACGPDTSAGWSTWSTWSTFFTWSTWSTNTSLSVPTVPYSTMVLSVKSRSEAGEGTAKTSSVTVPAEVPGEKVNAVTCSLRTDYNRYVCLVYINLNCSLDHGPDFSVLLVISPLDQQLQQYYGAETFSGKDISSDDTIIFWILPTKLLHFTQYQVTAYPANQAGPNYNLGKLTNLTTRPAAPGRVTNVTVQKAATSLIVTWGDPEDVPLKGQVENFKVDCYRIYYIRSKSLVTKNKTVTISGLTVNTEYTIQISAKNQGVPDYGPVVQVTATTRAGKPSPPVLLHSSHATNTSVVVTWAAPQYPAGKIMYYLVRGRPFLTSRTDSYTWNFNTTNMNQEFTAVGAGVEVEVEVSACNQQHCSDWTVQKVWTRPESPHITSDLQFITSYNNTITILLPHVTTLPAWQWIVVYKEHNQNNGEQEHSLKAEELEQKQDLEEYKMIRKVEMMAEKLVREYPQKTPDSSLWIAGKLYQEKNKIKKEFVVGDNKNNTGFLNRHLTSDSKYWLTVVTETTAGSYRELIASKSMVYVSTPPSNSVWWVVVVVVVVVVVLVVVLLALTVFIWRIRSRKKTSVIAVHPPSIHYNHHNGLLSSENSLTSNNTSLPEARLSSEQDLVYKNVQEVYANKQEEVYENEQEEVFENEVREDEQEEVQFPDQDVTTEVIYSNVSHKIPRAQAETYLARIIHSPGIEEEFKSVPAILGKSCSHGKLQDNLKKNRYRNNLPYDDTRVKLPLINDLPHSDYINANYVQGHTRAEAFIATQGPKDFNADTVGDFWRMIWHTRCSLIVMVASLMENGKVKVARYWPEGEQLLHKDDLQVKLISTEVKMDFIIRTLQISKDKETREVRHYQYTSWPDHGVPQNPYGLAQMINNLTLEATTGPVTVHCSAGIGRTGTVLLVLLMLDQLNTSGYIDPHLALVHLREGRPRLVENTAQYTFGHQVLLEVLSGVTTSYKCSNFSEALEVLRLPQPPSNTSIMHQQFQKLKNLPKDMSFKFGKNPACAHLNRSQDILPADNRMVFLQNFGDNLESQYINVVRVNGMDMKNAYLAGEHPQQHTLDSIWRLVYERRVPLWVVIHTLPQNHPDYPDVVPSEEWQTISNMKIRLTGQQAFNNFTEYYVQITVPKSRVPAPHTCVLLLMEGWPYTDPLPASPDPLLGVVERVASLGTGHSASLFTCKDGVTGCGVMMALLHLVARIQLLQEVDVYRVVLNIIYDRPQFITTIEQYDFLHTAGASFLASFREYGNFN